MNKNVKSVNSVLISVVITTYNRAYHLIKILHCLKKNYSNFSRFEVIICDSNSKDLSETKVRIFKLNHNYLKITYLNISQNLNSVKRNIGFVTAVGKYVIFLDDDCYPDSDFLKNYFHILSTENTKNKIFCGSVKYPQYLMKNLFVRYRQTRHFFFKKKIGISDNELGPEKIVTMNMAIAKNNFLYNQKLFNEKFNLYGFEDFEFGCRVIDNNFKIIACSPLVYHHDDRSFSLYLNKIRFLGNQSMKYLLKINPSIAKKNNFYKLENNLVVRSLLKFKFVNFLLKNVEIILINIEQLKFFPSFLYKVAFAVSYLSGCIQRKFLYEDFKINKWYK
jgi:glycosyltransferase involved in cell wall biosynthesis